MAVTVLDSADLVQSVITGQIPVPKGIAEDNAAQAAKREAKAPEAKPNHTVQDNAKPNGDATDQSGVQAAEGKTANADAAKAGDKGSEPVDDDVEGEDGLTPRQKREFTKSMLATIAKKHRAQKEAEELAASEYSRGRLAEERAAKLERELARIKEQSKPAETQAEGPPDRSKFETDQAYDDAVIDYRVDQRLKAREATEAQAREEAQQQELIQHARARIERAIEIVPDFKEVTEAVDMAVPPHIAGYMQESDLFAEMGYHFAKHPDVLTKLTEYTANTQPGTPAFVRGITRSLVELGKIESKLSAFAPVAKVESQVENGAKPSQDNGVKPSTETGSAPSKPRTQAPIIRPLSAGSGAQVEKDETEMKTPEVLTAWQKKHGVALTARKRH